MSTKTTPATSVRTKTPERGAPVSRAKDFRPGVVPSPEMVNIFEEALSAPRRPLARAWVRNLAYDKKVWLDVDLLSRSGRLPHSETLPMQYLEPAGGSGDFFLADVPVKQSSRTARPATAHQLRYRLYYEVEGQVFTDGICHHHTL